MSIEVAERERKRTLLDLKDKLSKYGKCCVPRGVGFGKTTMAANLIKEYKRVLFLYPTSIIQSTAEDVLASAEDINYDIKDGTFYSPDGSMVITGNVIFRTYRSILNIKNYSEWLNFDLIITDECHRIGAKKTAPALHKILEINPTAHFVGLSGTLERPDKIDVALEFFDNICVYEYTLHDMFEDGMLIKPYYYFGTYDVDEAIKEVGLSNNLILSESDIKIAKSKFVCKNGICNMPEQIRTVLNKYTEQTSYIKFIVFYDDLENISVKGKEVEDWFRTAFPDHNIESIEVSCRTNITKDVSRLRSLKYKENTIQIIHARDMLNMGYHVEDLTGIIMLRGTRSPIVYNQQLGRALSSGDTHGKIVFDLVNNIQRKSMSEYNSNTSNKSIEELLSDYNDIVKELSIAIENNDKSKAILLQRRKNKVNSQLIKAREDFAKGESVEKSSGGRCKLSYILPEDLVVVNNIASDRDFIIKTVFDTRMDACKKALVDYCSHYARSRGKYLKDTNEYYLIGFIKSNNITEEKLVALSKEFEASKGKRGLRDIPLDPFCISNKVAVKTVIEYMRCIGAFN